MSQLDSENATPSLPRDCSRGALDSGDARQSGRLSQPLVWAFFAIWIVLAAAGMGLLAAYANSAGKSTLAPESIPPVVDGSSHGYRLFMFVHPRCPCSVASVEELARIMSRCSTQIDSTVYFFHPLSKPDEWVRSSLWNSATAIPGVRVQVDDDGEMASRFNATTSGDVLLYDAAGKLRFHGGITSARGHAGDNLGESAVISIVLGGSTNVERSPVFGCSLRSELASDGK